MMADSKEYRRVRITKGDRGWGGPLIIEPKAGRDLIYCVTSGGIHPVAQRIADLTGGTVFDGFKARRDYNEIAVAVIDCGGTARVSIYPSQGVMTVDVRTAHPSGPLFDFITEEIFVSGVSEDQIELFDGQVFPSGNDRREETHRVATENQEIIEPVPDEAIDAPVVEAGDDAVSEKQVGFFGRLFGRK